MQREFMQSKTSQGQENHFERTNEKSSADVWPSVLSAPPHAGQSPQLPRRPTGLLSAWKYAQLQQSADQLKNLALPSVSEQETLKYPAIQGPITRPTLHTNIAQQQPFFSERVTAHQSTLTPVPALFHTPKLQPFGPPSQPLVAESQPQTLQPSHPQSLPAQPSHPSQTMQPMWQPSSPPPFVQGPAGPNFKKKPGKKRRFPIWARVAVAILLVLIIAGGSGAYYYEANFAKPLANITGQRAPRLKGDDAPNQGRNSGGSILSGGRSNILLLGSDDDYKSVHVYGGVLAQTDIVVSIDPKSQSVTMFSIPRDTWLNVPGFGMHKLDQAYLLGGGGAQGAALSMATIHQDFGIYIDHYAWVGLTGFTKVINTVGGVDVNVIHPITDDAYPDDTSLGALDPYAFKRLYIAPGPQHLVDLAALEYVRSRHADLVGDFGRSVRQQQVLNQLKYKLDNPNIFGQLPTLANDLNGYVKTDMQLTDVLSLMNFARSLDQSKIKKITLGPPYSGDAQVNTPAGIQDVVVLNCGIVQPLIAKTFALGSNAKCNTQANSSSTSRVATGPQKLPTSSTDGQTGITVNNPWQMASVSTMSLGGNGSDFMGIHSLLNLLFLVVFESPAALNV